MASESKQSAPVEMQISDASVPEDALREQLERIAEMPDNQSDDAIYGYVEILGDNRGDEAALRIKEESIYR